jgi:hypothetical protein
MGPGAGLTGISEGIERSGSAALNLTLSYGGFHFAGVTFSVVMFSVVGAGASPADHGGFPENPLTRTKRRRAVLNILKQKPSRRR